ncbi:alpha-ribazole phosphatase [Tateyamaria sp. ANG-S1]|nr:alpha-ribazole phosphatase [Tateyamaria sp. ANG-S1]
MLAQTRDHGGGLDAAIAQYGGHRPVWIDLSTGINPTPYSLPDLSQTDWTALPDKAAADRLVKAARVAWNVPDSAAILATPGASAAIAQIPRLAPAGTVQIPQPTYNEHAASFANAGWTVRDDGQTADAQVLVHPNNPDGRHWAKSDLCAPLKIIDESFCDVSPEASLIETANQPGTLILKSFGKFWGLAGVRLGFVIGDPALVVRLAEMLGPWPVSGIALTIGAAALEDHAWADQMRVTLTQDATRLDTLLQSHGAQTVGGTTLFRLYNVGDAAAWQTRLARSHVWSRIFPYSKNWLRLGLPPADRWSQLESAL